MVGRGIPADMLCRCGAIPAPPNFLIEPSDDQVHLLAETSGRDNDLDADWKGRIDPGGG